MTAAAHRLAVKRIRNSAINKWREGAISVIGLW